MSFPRENREATFRWNQSAKTAALTFTIPRKTRSHFFMDRPFAERGGAAAPSFRRPRAACL